MKRVNSAQFKVMYGRKTRRSKHNNIRIEYDGIKFDSIKEKNRYIVLKMLLKNGNISKLRLQVKYELIPKNDLYRSIKYYSDFVYIENGVEVVEDVKGMLTDVYKLKRKLMYHLHGIIIKET